jgi:hypothetical protein
MILAAVNASGAVGCTGTILSGDRGGDGGGDGGVQSPLESVEIQASPDPFVRQAPVLVTVRYPALPGGDDSPFVLLTLQSDGALDVTLPGGVLVDKIDNDAIVSDTPDDPSLEGVRANYCGFFRTEIGTQFAFRWNLLCARFRNASTEDTFLDFDRVVWRMTPSSQSTTIEVQAYAGATIDTEVLASKVFTATP